ncbi:MAG TPA: hypothetical protein VN961_07930 [Streptosporangiaceae bacterium]|nr:hypothetical protein [Streptosporangiaceae bacterium]
MVGPGRMGANLVPHQATFARSMMRPILQRERASFSIGGWLTLLPGRTVADVAAAHLRFVMSRHSSLRTRLQFAAAGRPQQVVASSGEALLEVVDAGDDRRGSRRRSTVATTRGPSTAPASGRSAGR